MSVFGSLQLSHGLVLCGNQRSNKWKNSGVSRVKLRQLNAALSSRVSFQQQDSFMCVSDFVHRPIRSPPNRCISFSCYSFSLPGKAFELPSIKAASLALSKSYNLVQRSPLIVKLAPAFAILAFSLWGLVPLARQCRSLLNKSDNSWKKSSTYHVITSYVQPLLLWSGALLICRALDPISLPTQASQMVKNRLLNFVRSLSTVLAFAYCFSSAIQQTQKFFMETSDSSDARNMGFQFAGKALYSAVWVGAVSLFMELLGFPTQKWLTAGGFGTVLITLAGREIFTNFLSSIMIHATRPFVLNEWIQTKIEGYEVSGTVEHVGWWSPTIIRGEDREALHIPNHKFTVNVVRNLSQKTHWRIKTHLAISHLDVNKINIIVADMRKVLAKNPQVEQQRLHRRVFLENVDPENQALLILISCFVKTSHHEEYYCVKEAILLDLLRVISHHGARLATPIRTIRKMNGESDLDNFPYGDSRFGRGGMASKRPLLLIEPSYKINGEEKPKSQNRTSKPTNDQEAKIPSPKSKENPKTGDTTNSELLSGDESGLKSSKPNSKTNIKDLDTQGQDSTKPKGGSSTKQPKTENLRTNEAERADNSQTSASRSSLEENIVLGVALEGSKRTLPIEEETDPSSSAPQDAKELAGARRKGNGSSTGDKDNKKDGNMQSSSGTSNSEQ